MSQGLFFALLSLLLYMIGLVPYIYHVFHGRVIPHPFSWSIWFIFSSLNLYILFETTGGFTWSLASLSIRTLALFIGLSCGWYMIRNITISRFDYLSLSLAFLVIIYMSFYGMRQAIYVMILADIVILMPTIRKIWNDPQTEDAFIWFMTALSQVCLLASLPFFTFENSFFWFYAIMSNTSVGLLIHLRARYIQDSFFKKTPSIFCFKKETVIDSIIR